MKATRASSKGDLRRIYKILKSLQSDISLIKGHLVSIFYEDPDSEELESLYSQHKNGKWGPTTGSEKDPREDE